MKKEKGLVSGEIFITDDGSVDDSFITESIVREPNWRFLPEETRTWAVERARELFRFIEEKSRRREEAEVQSKEQPLGSALSLFFVCFR